MSVASQTVSAQQNPSLDKYFSQKIGLSQSRIAAIRNGQPVTKALASRTPDEVFLFGAIYIHSAPEKYVQFPHDYNRLRKLPSNLFIVMLGFLFVGPKRLPTILGQIGRAKAQLENATRNLKSELETEVESQRHDEHVTANLKTGGEQRATRNLSRHRSLRAVSEAPKTTISAIRLAATGASDTALRLLGTNPVSTSAIMSSFTACRENFVG